MSGKDTSKLDVPMLKWWGSAEVVSHDVESESIWFVSSDGERVIICLKDNRSTELSAQLPHHTAFMNMQTRHCLKGLRQWLSVCTCRYVKCFQYFCSKNFMQTFQKWTKKIWQFAKWSLYFFWVSDISEQLLLTTRAKLPHNSLPKNRVKKSRSAVSSVLTFASKNSIYVCS